MSVSVFSRFSADAARKRIKKYAFSYENGLVWPGRQLTRQPVMSFQQKGIGIDTNRPGAGAPNVDKSGNLKVRKGQTLTKSSNGRKYIFNSSGPSLCHTPVPVALIKD